MIDKKGLTSEVIPLIIFFCQAVITSGHTRALKGSAATEPLQVVVDMSAISNSECSYERTKPVRKNLAFKKITYISTTSQYDS